MKASTSNESGWFWPVVIVGSLLLLGKLGGNTSGSDGEVDKILKAKEQVRMMVNYPDTLQFHNMSTSVSGNQVTLKFTAKNAFGVPETHTRTLQVR